ITCLNHVATYASHADSTVMDIANAVPDRDIAFIFKDVEPMPVAIRNVPVDEPGNAVEICTFYPLAEHKDKPINLNVVVDCSGSMDGIPISQARNALKNLFEKLEEKDTITFTRFGNEFIHDISAPTSVSPMNLRRDIEPLLQKLAADLGGTEMERALSSVFKMATPSSDVLLITDGDIWNVDPIIKEATESGHRIFVIGVSSAPAEPLLKQLAEKTNGACAVVMPAEDMKPVLIRMVEKMHTSQFSYELTRGEQKKEVKLWAGQSATFIWNESRPSALPELTCLTNPDEKILSPNRWTPNSSIELYRSLIKIYALRLYRQTQDENKRKEISEKFGLLSPYVSFVMVNERAEAEKFKGFPDSQITPQMYRDHVLTSPQTFDLGPEKDWEFIGLEPGFYGCAQAPSSESCGILGEAQPQREASPSMLKNPKTARKTTTSRSRTKKKPSPFTAEQEDWIRQRLQMASMYYVFSGNVHDISMLIDDCQGYLLAVDPQRISEEGKIALAFLVLEAYFQKYIRKNDEDKSLTSRAKEAFLALVPYKETYIKRSCEKLMPENVLIPFLMYQISSLEYDLNEDEEEPDSDPDPE
ncbi:MAG: VWA domain-containing protein, partial [Burkholderiales bacterium]|nr:VWA domain-containing protein [Burkholderiales bacterium]